MTLAASRKRARAAELGMTPRADTITTTAAPSCSALMLPLVCVPSGGMIGSSSARSSMPRTSVLLIARLLGGHAQRHDLAQEAPLAGGLLGLQVRVQRVGILPVAA